jgi:hypothetical protein
MLRKALTIFFTVWFIALFICGFLAYMVTSHNAAGPCDGLGRHLSEAPTLMRIFFGQDRMWPGWGWFFADMVIFWGSIAAATSVFSRLDPK